MAWKTRRAHRLPKMRFLLCAALAGATVQAHAQADPACYVVNRVLLWLKPEMPPVECARARATSASRAAESPAPRATATAPPINTTARRPP